MLLRKLLKNAANGLGVRFEFWETASIPLPRHWWRRCIRREAIKNSAHFPPWPATSYRLGLKLGILFLFLLNCSSKCLEVLIESLMSNNWKFITVFCLLLWFTEKLTLSPKMLVFVPTNWKQHGHFHCYVKVVGFKMSKSSKFLWITKNATSAVNLAPQIVCCYATTVIEAVVSRVHIVVRDAVRHFVDFAALQSKLNWLQSSYAFRINSEVSLRFPSIYLLLPLPLFYLLFLFILIKTILKTRPDIWFSRPAVFIFILGLTMLVCIQFWSSTGSLLL